jgi:flagellar protein FlbD
MLKLTRLNHTEFVLNCDLIETVEAKPDTTIRLTTGNIYIVSESVDDVIDATLEYKKGLYSGAGLRRGEN